LLFVCLEGDSFGSTTFWTHLPCRHSTIWTLAPWLDHIRPNPTGTKDGGALVITTPPKPEDTTHWTTVGFTFFSKAHER
jgi:hypothetical protein